MLAGGLLYAQPSGRDVASRVDPIREKMLRAHGGGKNLNRLSTFEYSVLETNYISAPPATSRTNYFLDLKKRQLTATSTTEGITIVKTINGSDAWQEIDGIRMTLPEEEREKLERAYFLNFLTLLRNDDSVFEFKRNCQYKGSTANVLLVSNPLNPAQQASLFVSDQTGRVLALSWHEARELNQMLHYTDFLEYQPIGQGIIFPVKYQVYTNGDVTAEGRVVDIKVRK
ncbi:MAG: hypothetical protein LPK09_00205 [Hymenobacteraceae bacterium]|nr:hypothetical protein [Hymenobacteraceae bacterium]